jgi:hypothetical protein
VPVLAMTILACFASISSSSIWMIGTNNCQMNTCSIYILRWSVSCGVSEYTGPSLPLNQFRQIQTIYGDDVSTRLSSISVECYISPDLTDSGLCTPALVTWQETSCHAAISCGYPSLCVNVPPGFSTTQAFCNIQSSS